MPPSVSNSAGSGSGWSSSKGSRPPNQNHRRHSRGANGRPLSTEMELLKMFAARRVVSRPAPMDYDTRFSRPFAPVGQDDDGVTVLMPLPQSMSLFEELMPNFVVMYGPDLEAFRQLEVFQAEHPTHRVRLYLLAYSNSVEQQWFLNSVERESEAFNSLIRTKATMSISKHESKREATAAEKEITPQSTSTRQGGGLIRPRVEKNKRRKIVIDAREFRSTLPSLLHGGSFDISSVTLTVGDYILAPDICVERKSLSDLFQSLASGRLYTQADAMCKHYKIAILLIEFDEKRPFSFQSSSSVSNNISETAITSKLAILIHHFPRLRILWCRSPHMTVELFRRLKKNHEEPDQTAALRIGLPQDEQGGPAWHINESARECMLRMPGVNNENCYALIRQVPTIAALSNMDLDRLQKIIGHANGGELHTFLHNEFKDPVTGELVGRPK